jgi:hypothetical protein
LGHDRDAARKAREVGAAGARVVASGRRQGQTLIIQFPYAEAAFKDTFVYDPNSHTWVLVIESQGPDGTWSNFAKYTLARPVRKI